jgi:ATP-dependent Clp protease ATP-binding subunit ClpC
MFERFTDESRRVIEVAQQEAILMQHGHIGTEHLLVGLTSEPEVIALGLDRERARGEVVKTVGLGEHVKSRHIPFTAAAKEAMETALREAMGLGHRQIRPGHLLLAVLKQRDGVGRRVLVAAGAVPSELRATIIERLQATPASSETPGEQHEFVTTALGRALLGDFGAPDVDGQLLLAILRGGGSVAAWLSERGVSEDAVRRLF